MAESDLSLTYNQLANEVGGMMNFGRDYTAFSAADASWVQQVIERGIRQFYFPPPLPGEKIAHQWSFLHPYTTLSTVAPYATGTVAVASGVVTLTSGTFPSWAAQGDFSVGGQTYQVSTRDSGTQLTLLDTSVTASSGSSYSLSRSRYDLPDNFGGIEGALTYQSNNVGARKVEIVNEVAIREQRSTHPQLTGKPRLAAVRTKSPVVDTGQRFELFIWPNADAIYILNYRYMILHDMIEGSEYPLGGMAHAETVLASCLYIAAQYVNSQENQERLRADFMSRLEASVNLDRAAMAPDHIVTQRISFADSKWEMPFHCDLQPVTYTG